MPTKGPYPFKEKKKQYYRCTLDSLRWQIKDAQEAAEALGRDNPDSAWYWDDFFTLCEVFNEKKSRGY